MERLHSVGLDVPQVTDLIYRLRSAGIKGLPDALDPDEAAKILAPLLTGTEITMPAARKAPQPAL